MRLVLERDIRPGEESGYIELSFELPEGVERLDVSYEVTPLGEYKSVIDLGAKDASRVRGWSGGARERFFIEAERATPGYLAGALTAGPWAVLLGAYKIGAGGCRVKVSVEATMERGRWLSGELHAHTVHSDGALTVSEAERSVRGLGLDFLALTDHNTVSQNYAAPRDAETVLIPAMELTTNFGHCNFYGAVDPCADFRATTIEQLREIIGAARSAGAAVSLNHPHCRSCGWLWDFDIDYDWVEIWNGPWREDNRKTLDWWQAQLAGGRVLPAVGGSDFHREHPWVKHGRPTNWVFAASRTAKGILEAVGRGRVTLSNDPGGPFVELTLGGGMIGDTVSAADALATGVSLRATRLRQGDRLALVTERGTEAEFVVGADEGEALYAIPASERLFYRAEVWRYESAAADVLLAAATNPIYIR
ncbi:CehA/McbA family metallohydrolase [Paenibacillus sp. TRM 82003]|nr:CehA/McbA family metallohydrolase [Paenibacillus sp. TRM 82003]